MIDERAASAQFEKSNSSQYCPVCGTTPPKTNNNDACQKESDL